MRVVTSTLSLFFGLVTVAVGIVGPGISLVRGESVYLNVTLLALILAIPIAVSWFRLALKVARGRITPQSSRLPTWLSLALGLFFFAGGVALSDRDAREGYRGDATLYLFLGLALCVHGVAYDEVRRQARAGTTRVT